MKRRSLEGDFSQVLLLYFSFSFIFEKIKAQFVDNMIIVLYNHNEILFWNCNDLNLLFKLSLPKYENINQLNCFYCNNDYLFVGGNNIYYNYYN